jgi:hypothetical protein
MLWVRRGPIWLCGYPVGVSAMIMESLTAALISLTATLDFDTNMAIASCKTPITRLAKFN